MADPSARASLLQRILAAARSDERIVGVVDYGSSSEGRSDEWSDLDLTLFIRDTDYDAFARDWKRWAAQFGTLLLAYIGGVGHPWTVYAAQPIPLRVDFECQRESQIAGLERWPNSPTSVEAMVLFDASGGRLAAGAQQLVGRSLRPADVLGTFERVCGDFWYYMLFVHCKLQRGDAWHARQRFHVEVMQNLFALLRLEAGALDHWQGVSPASQAERWLSPRRLAQLDACVPAGGPEGLRAALTAAATLGREVCASIAAAQGWRWPEELGACVLALLDR
jgi:hypothetical protein